MIEEAAAGAATELLNRGAGLEARTSDGETPLWLAAFYGHEGIAACLLAAGAKTDVRVGESESTLLHMLATRGHEALVDILCRGGADVNAVAGDVTPLSVALYAEQAEVAAALRRAGAREEEGGLEPQDQCLDASAPLPLAPFPAPPAAETASCAVWTESGTNSLDRSSESLSAGSKSRSAT